MAHPTRPEPMNAVSSHPKVKLQLTLAEPYFVAGGWISGKMEMDCTAGVNCKGGKANGGGLLGLGLMGVELFAIQELNSRDHSARSTFIHARRLFQGPGLPPSNAVVPTTLTPSPSSPNGSPAHISSSPTLPQHYHPARKGHTTFLFRLPLPSTSPSSISFPSSSNGVLGGLGGGGSPLASVRYEIRASVGVWWKGERVVVMEKKEAEVVEGFDLDRLVRAGLLPLTALLLASAMGDPTAGLPPLGNGRGLWGIDEPQVTVVGENGKIWCQGRVIGGLLVAGESACIELQVRNGSGKKNSSLSLTLSRSLKLASTPDSDSQHDIPLEISDTVLTIPFRGPEYVIPPGVEGVASLVFDVPKSAKGVRGGMLMGDEAEALVGGDGGRKGKGGVRETQGLFEVECVVQIKLGMGLGSKDITLEIPVLVVHPAVLPALPEDEYPYPYPYDASQPPLSPQAYYDPNNPTAYYDPNNPYTHAHAPPPQAYYDPHAMSHTPAPYAIAAGGYPSLPMSPGPGAAYDPNANLVWLPPPGALSPGVGYGYAADPYHAQQQPYAHAVSPQQVQPYAHAPGYVSPAPPMQMQLTGQNTGMIPRPSSADPYSTNSAQVQALLSPPLPGLPPTLGTNPLLAPTLPPMPGSVKRSPSTVSRADSARYGGDLGVGSPSTHPVGASGPSSHNLPTNPHNDQTTSTVPDNAISGEAGPGQRASRIAQTLRVTSQATGRGRSVSPQGGRRYPLPPSNSGVGGVGASPGQGPASNLRLNLQNLPQSPNVVAGGTLKTPLLSPRPVLSPKQSSASLAQQNKSSAAGESANEKVPKSERVEELERMADEVGKRAKDLSGDLPNEKDKDRDLDIQKTLPGPPVPTETDKARFSRARADDYFSHPSMTNGSGSLAAPAEEDNSKGGARSRSRTPPTPATPTLTPSRGYPVHAVKGKGRKGMNGVHAGSSTNAYSAKSKPSANLLGFDLPKRSTESGLDALERKLLAEVGTRKVNEEKRPDVWSVLGTGKDQQSHNAKEQKDNKSGDKTTKPSPILNSSASPSAVSPAPSNSSPMFHSGPSGSSGPSPIAIPRRDSSDRDPLNDSAISSLTLPDCGDPMIDLNANTPLDMKDVWGNLERDVGAGADAVEANNPWRTERFSPEAKDYGGYGTYKEDRDAWRSEREGERERDRDSDEKTHKGSSKKRASKEKLGSEREQRRSSRRKEREREKEGSDSERKRNPDSERKSDRKSDRRKAKEGKEKSSRTTASKGRVAAWLGAVEAEPAEPPLDDVIAPTPSPKPEETFDVQPSPLSKPSDPSSSTKPSSSSPIEKIDNHDDSAPTSIDPIPNPRSSGFVPLGTLKRDIYQRTLVPSDSPLASTSVPGEDARRVRDLWKARTGELDGKDVGAGRGIRDLWGGNAGRAIDGTQAAGGLPIFPPRKSAPSDPEVKYDIRSARGGKGGRVSAVAAIWAGAAGGANPVPPSPVSSTPRSPLSGVVSPTSPGPKSPLSGSAGAANAIPKPKPISASSSSSSTDGKSQSQRQRTSLSSSKPNLVSSKPNPVSSRPNPISSRPNLGLGKSTPTSSPSSSHAKPTLSSTASLARPPGEIHRGGNVNNSRNALGVGIGSAGGKGGNPVSPVRKSPFRVPPTISEFSEASVSSGVSAATKATNYGLGATKETATNGVGSGAGAGKLGVVTSSASGAGKTGVNLGLGSGSAANNLRKLGDTKPSISELSGAGEEPKSITSIAGEHLAFGQARLRDLIKKYQGQGAS